jgi:hypothetical protein
MNGMMRHTFLPDVLYLQWSVLRGVPGISKSYVDVCCVFDDVWLLLRFYLLNVICAL